MTLYLRQNKQKKKLYKLLKKSYLIDVDISIYDEIEKHDHV